VKRPAIGTGKSVKSAGEQFVARCVNSHDKSLWNAKVFAFCFPAFANRDRKSCGSRVFHLVVAAGDPISGDIILAFCRRSHATRSGKAERIAVVERQNEASFCFIWLNSGFATEFTAGSISRQGAKAPSSIDNGQLTTDKTPVFLPRRQVSTKTTGCLRPQLRGAPKKHAPRAAIAQPSEILAAHNDRWLIADR
jgi:hypothetical protein